MPKNLEMTSFLKAVRRLSRALDVHSSRINREYGLTLPQMIVLTCIRELGEVTSRAISEAADLSPPTVVGILNKLEGKKLIERYRSVSDRRIVHTRLTDSGQCLLSNAPSPMGDLFESRFMSLEKNDRLMILSAINEAAELSVQPESRLD